ncbi:hypothetical protein VUR80DRAFT_9795 [Thermomyces stellatus]
MEDFDLPDIVAEVRAREARCSATDGTPGDAEPVSVPLNWIDWADPSDERRVPVLAKLCSVKPEIDRLCSTCEKEGVCWCGAYGVRYCTRKCQKEDWRRHKLICRMFAKWDYSTRPSEDHCLAILCPTDQKEPELFWCRLTDDETYLEVTHPDVHRLSHRKPRGLAIQVNISASLRRLYLGHGLSLLDVYGLTEIEKDGLLNVNKSIRTLTAPGALTFYSGPQVIFAFEGNDVGEPGKGMDVVPRDWRHATDYILLSRQNPSVSVTGVLPVLFSTRLNNTASLLVNQIHHIEKPIENVLTPVSFFPRGGPCSAAFQLGLPWKTRCVLGCELGGFSNNMKHLAAYLYRRPRRGESGSFEWTTTSQYKCGSIIIMAVASGRVVHQHHVTALNKYLDFSLKRCIVPSKEGFMEYWDTYIDITNHFEDMRSIFNPYQGLPLREHLVVSPGESSHHRRALMNLLGHFSSNGFKMEVQKVNDVLVPVDVTAPFDVTGNFEFTDEERDVPSGSFAVFGTALRGTREEEAQESR